jgi:hypothetical protein
MTQVLVNKPLLSGLVKFVVKECLSGGPSPASVTGGEPSWRLVQQLANHIFLGMARRG